MDQRSICGRSQSLTRPLAKTDYRLRHVVVTTLILEHPCRDGKAESIGDQVIAPFAQLAVAAGRST